MSNSSWVLVFGIIVIGIVIATNFMNTKDITGSITTTLFDFDDSLSNYIDTIKTKDISGTKAIIPVIIILAHIGIYLFILLIFTNIFEMGPFVSLLLCALTILLLHVFYFAVIDNGQITLQSIKSLFPFSGLLTVFNNIEIFQNSYTSFVENKTITNSTENITLDLTK